MHRENAHLAAILVPGSFVVHGSLKDCAPALRETTFLGSEISIRRKKAFILV